MQIPISRAAAPAMRSRHPARTGKLSPRAVLLVVAAVLCFAIVDGLIKWLSARYPVLVVVWGRWGVQAVVMILWLGPRMGRNLLRTAHPGIQLVRGGILILSSVLFVNALRFLPLADATALNYTTPTLVVILAAIFLKERLTRPRIAFVVAGVIGMALIVRPGASILHGAAALALVAAACYAVFQILTRRLAGEDARVLLFYPALMGLVVFAAFMPWRLMPADVPWTHVAMMIVAGLFGTVGHFLFILAFQRAPASAVTPFTYLHLVWAILVGWIAFNDFPDRISMLGMGIIAGSGLLLTLHERRQHRLELANPPTID